MRYPNPLTKTLAFRDARDWAQFHNPKDLAISISLEAAELLEIFQWSGTETDVSDPEQLHAVEKELADIVIYCMYLADRLGIDIPQAVSDKIDENEAKYPVDKSKGNARKYTEL